MYREVPVEICKERIVEVDRIVEVPVEKVVIKVWGWEGTKCGGRLRNSFLFCPYMSVCLPVSLSLPPLSSVSLFVFLSLFLSTGHGPRHALIN